MTTDQEQGNEVFCQNAKIHRIEHSSRKFAKPFIVDSIINLLMRNENALALISKHKQLIIVTIGIAAIASYMIPFGNLFAMADASYGHYKKSKFDWKLKKHDIKFKKHDWKFAQIHKKIQQKFIDNSWRN